MTGSFDRVLALSLQPTPPRQARPATSSSATTSELESLPPPPPPPPRPPLAWGGGGGVVTTSSELVLLPPSSPGCAGTGGTGFYFAAPDACAGLVELFPAGRGGPPALYLGCGGPAAVQTGSAGDPAPVIGLAQAGGGREARAGPA